jgi:hypothetical protein
VVRAAAASAAKEQRQRNAVDKKRKREKEREAAGKKPRAARTSAERSAEPQESRVWISFISAFLSRS